MRFIHTSDWHLGQTLHNFERGFEHQCFLDWLMDTLGAVERQLVGYCPIQPIDVQDSGGAGPVGGDRHGAG